MWDDYSQLGATRLVGYLSSHIQRALVEYLLIILSTEFDHLHGQRRMQYTSYLFTIYEKFFDPVKKQLLDSAEVRVIWNTQPYLEQSVAVWSFESQT